MNDNLKDALEQLREALFRPSELAFERVCALVAQAAEAHSDDARRVLLPYADGTSLYGALGLYPALSSPALDSPLEPRRQPLVRPGTTAALRLTVDGDSIGM